MSTVGTLANRFANLPTLGTRCFFNVELLFPNGYPGTLNGYTRIMNLIQSVNLPNLSIKQEEKINDPYNGIFHTVGSGVIQPADEVELSLLDEENEPIFETFFYPWLKHTQTMKHWPIRATLKVDLYNNKFELNKPTITYTLFEVTPSALDLPNLTYDAPTTYTRQVRLHFNSIKIETPNFNSSIDTNLIKKPVAPKIIFESGFGEDNYPNTEPPLEEFFDVDEHNRKELEKKIKQKQIIDEQVKRQKENQEKLQKIKDDIDKKVAELYELDLPIDEDTGEYIVGPDHPDYEHIEEVKEQIVELNVEKENTEKFLSDTEKIHKEELELQKELKYVANNFGKYAPEDAEGYHYLRDPQTGQVINVTKIPSFNKNNPNPIDEHKQDNFSKTERKVTPWTAEEKAEFIQFLRDDYNNFGYTHPDFYYIKDKDCKVRIGEIPEYISKDSKVREFAGDDRTNIFGNRRFGVEKI